MAKARSAKASSSATVGFETKLWLAADKLRNNMDAAEYKHVVLGLIFLKYISDTFEEHRTTLVAGKGEFQGADPEDKDEYLAASAEEIEDDGEPFEQKMTRLVEQLNAQFKESAKLEKAIRANLKGLGYEGKP